MHNKWRRARATALRGRRLCIGVRSIAYTPLRKSCSRVFCTSASSSCHAAAHCTVRASLRAHVRRADSWRPRAHARTHARTHAGAVHVNPHRRLVRVVQLSLGARARGAGSHRWGARRTAPYAAARRPQRHAAGRLASCAPSRGAPRAPDIQRSNTNGRQLVTPSRPRSRPLPKRAFLIESFPCVLGHHSTPVWGPREGEGSRRAKSSVSRGTAR